MEPLEKLHNIPYYQRDKYSGEKALSYKHNGNWIHFSSQQICEEISLLANGLSLKYPDQTNIGIFANSGSPMWNIVDFAIIKSHNISVPIHGNASENDVIHILKDANIKLVFVDGESQMKLLKSLNVSGLELYSLVNDSDDYYQSLFKDSPSEKLKNETIDPSQLATILYTSGSTGLPKGVMLSHTNIMSVIKSVISLLPIHHKHTTASYLPLSHIFERVATYVFMTVGASIYYIDDPKALLKNVQEIRPHYMTSVPRVLEKVYNFINVEIKKSGLIKRKIVKWALASSKRARRHSPNPLRRVELAVCDLLVFRKWRKVMGGRLLGLMVGAAAMPKHISMLFSDAGIHIREGYGLTETSPIISFNRFEAGGNRFGTVGIPLPAVTVKIDNPDENGEGEVIVKGPNVMMGYYKNPTLTKEKIDSAGWFHTGDIGKIVHKRFLQITDRKKNIFKTSSGQYVAPQVIEAQLRRNEMIDQNMIIGFNQPYITALIIPDFELLEAWCKENNVHWTGPQYMVLHPKVVELYQGLIDDLNQGLKRHEFIKRFHLLYEEWSISTGEYTPTLKLKRKTILEKFSKEIGKLYQE